MKVKDEEKDVDVESPSNAAFLVHEDDWITCSIKHEIKINGDPAWVGFEAGTKVGENEDPDSAKERVIEYVSNAVIDSIKAAVTTANEVTG